MNIPAFLARTCVLTGSAKHFFHHLLVALMVASLVTLLHGLGALGWLDAAMLNTVGAGPQGTSQFADSRKDMPFVITIGSKLYEEEFQQSSPLERKKLALLLQAIPIGEHVSPQQIVFDIDMSPVSDRDWDSEGRKQLDHALKRLLSGGVHIVLPVPTRVATENLLALKGKWLSSLCELNSATDPGLVTIAPAQIKQNFGRVLQFDPHQLSLSSVAANAVTRKTDAKDAAILDSDGVVCRNLLRDSSQWIRSYLSVSFDETVFALQRPLVQKSLVPFNADFFQALDNYLLVAESLKGLPELIMGDGRNLAGRTLFIGGGFNDQDRFLSPFDRGGLTEGVVVHAASYFTILHPVTRVHGLWALFLDIAIGLLFAYAFEFTWGYYHRVAVVASNVGGWVNYLRLRGALLFNLGFVAIMVWIGMTAAAVYFFPRNIWINPGPIILGMFVKFGIASKTGAHSHHDSRPKIARWLEALVALCLIAAAFYNALHH